MSLPSFILPTDSSPFLRFTVIFVWLTVVYFIGKEKFKSSSNFPLASYTSGLVLSFSNAFSFESAFSSTVTSLSTKSSDFSSLDSISSVFISSEFCSSDFTIFSFTILTSFFGSSFKFSLPSANDKDCILLAINVTASVLEIFRFIYILLFIAI